MSQGEGLYLLGEVVRTSRPTSASIARPGGGTPTAARGSGLRPLTALELISHDMAESVVASALADSAHEHYSNAFIGDLMYVVYERKRLEREAAAVGVIEVWYAACIEQRRRRATATIMRSIVEDAMTSYAKEQEGGIAALMILSALRRWCLRCKAVRVYQQKLLERDARRIADAAMAEHIVEQQRHRAAVQIQRLARSVLARAFVSRLMIARQRQQRAVVLREASSVLVRFLATNAASRKFRRHVADRVEREKVERSTRAALAMQTCLRWQSSVALVAAKLAAQFHRCAVRLQKWWRVVHARQERRRRAAIAEQEQRRERLLDAVVTLQSYVRRFIARSAFVKRRNFARAFPLLQRIGRAYLVRSRGTLVQNRGQELAARCIQRFSRLVSSVRLLQRKRDWDRRAKILSHLEYAAQKIQRCWRLKEARGIAAANKIRIGKRHDAARVIQHSARMWSAKCHLARLQQGSRDVQYGAQLEQMALRIQTNFRGWQVRQWYAGVQHARAARVALLHRVAQNYLFRKDLAMYYLRNRRARAAYRIQAAFRRHKAQVLADRRFRMKVSLVTGIRQREAAAVAIQRNFRCFLGVHAYQRLRRLRHYAAVRIQTQVRMMLARQVLDALIYDYRREIAARRLQMRWLSVVHKFRQRRDVFEYEAQLLQMDLTALFRSEANSRRDVTLEEDHFWSRESYRFDTILRKLTEEYAVRLEAWRKRSPAELQEEAATRIQSVLRGHLSRQQQQNGSVNESTILGDDNDEDDDETNAMTEQMLNRYDVQRGRDTYLPSAGMDQSSVHRASKVATGTAVAQNIRLLSHGLMPSLLQEAAARQHRSQQHQRHDMSDGAIDDVQSLPAAPPQSWFAWLAERPELCNRPFERLLQRETSARIRVEQMFEVELALLRSHWRVPENAHLRPLLALTTRTHSLAPAAARKATKDAAGSSSMEERGALTVLPSSTLTTPRRGVLLPPMLRPDSQAALHTHGVASIVTNTYPPSRAEALRDVLDTSREAVTGHLYQSASLSSNALNTGRRGVVGGAWEAKTPTNDHDAVDSSNGALLPTTSTSDGDGDRNGDQERHSPRDTAACDLRSLNLSETQLSLILEKLRSNTVFLALYLDHNRIHDHTCADIGGLMLHNSTIATYSLCHTDITDVGATHLVSSIMRAPHVLTVDLRGTMVTESYRKHLSHLLNRNVARAQQAREQREREEAIVRKAQLALRGGDDAPLPQASQHRTGFAALRSLPPPSPAASGAAGGQGSHAALAPVRTGRSAATAIKQNTTNMLQEIVEPGTVA